MIFCKYLANIVSYVLSKNEYSAIFPFEINKKNCLFLDFAFLTGVNRDSASGHAKPIAWV